VSSVVGACVGVLGMFFVMWSLVVSVCGSGIPSVGCNCMNVEVMDRCMHLK